MVEGDLSIPLFLAGTGVTILATGITQAGWRHRLLIFGLFAVGSILLLAGVCWHWLKDYSPTIATSVITELASNSVAWFVVIMLALVIALVRKPKISTLSAQETAPQLQSFTPADRSQVDLIGSPGQVLVPQDAYYLHDTAAEGYPHKLKIVLKNDSSVDFILTSAEWQDTWNLTLPPLNEHLWQPEGRRGWQNDDWGGETNEALLVRPGRAIQTWVGLPAPLDKVELRRRMMTKRLGTLIVPLTIDGRTTLETIKL